MSWLCAWCAMYGKFPISKAYQPDSEKGVLTIDDEKICKLCATNWHAAKRKDSDGTIQKASSPKT